MCVVVVRLICFFFKQKTAYEMRISDWSSDVCSSDLAFVACSNYPECKYTRAFAQPGGLGAEDSTPEALGNDPETGLPVERKVGRFGPYLQLGEGKDAKRASIPKDVGDLDLEIALKLRSEEHTSELQSLMRISYAV